MCEHYVVGLIKKGQLDEIFVMLIDCVTVLSYCMLLRKNSTGLIIDKDKKVYERFLVDYGIQKVAVVNEVEY